MFKFKAGTIQFIFKHLLYLQTLINIIGYCKLR